MVAKLSRSMEHFRGMQESDWESSIESSLLRPAAPRISIESLDEFGVLACKVAWLINQRIYLATEAPKVLILWY